MADARWFAAADLGASSGRVIVGRLHGGRMELTEVHRWENGPLEEADGLHWNTPALFGHVVDGLNAAIDASGGRLESVGIDTWGVDYGRFDAQGELLELPFHYRDSRTDGTIDRLFSTLPPEKLYAAAGLEVQPFNTIFQLVSQAHEPQWASVERLLLTPDLLGFWLTGRPVAEVTIASTTGLMEVAERRWSSDVLAHLDAEYGLPLARVLPELVEPGTIVGPSRPGVLTKEVPWVAVGSHDTASAVVAVPADRPDFAFISSGTWSLVGLELPAPVLTEASRQANFTNEQGVDGTTRYLKNVMGLWVLIECRREWKAAGQEFSWTELVDLARAEPPLRCVLDMSDDRLLPPGDMLGRLAAMAAETGQPWDPRPGAVTRAVLDSLAMAYRRAIRQACTLADADVSVVHIVGGGSQNALLCELTAEATGLPVVAGPTEGTAMGSLLVQARTMGALDGGLTDLRRVSAASAPLVTYRPGCLGIPAAQWTDVEKTLTSTPR